MEMFERLNGLSEKASGLIGKVSEKINEKIEDVRAQKEAEAAARGLTVEQMKGLQKAQRGELDAVWMYRRLAGKVADAEDREAFLRLADDEQRHADVFLNRTGKSVRANPAKAIFIPLMYKIIGKEKLYPIIADAEYKAASKYEHIISDFPEVQDVLDDEIKHGDAVKDLL